MVDTANFPKFGALDSLGKRSGKFPNFILNAETARCSGCVPYDVEISDRISMTNRFSLVALFFKIQHSNGYALKKLFVVNY